MQQSIAEACTEIQKANAILITAGAGMSVDSGLPDFKGNDGFWRAYSLLEERGMCFEDIPTPKLFETNPSLAWAFYGQRLKLYRNTFSHNGFKLLLELVQKKKNNYFIYTSNVDGHFQKAGFDARRIVEVHGNIHYMRCTKHCSKEIWSGDNIDIAVNMQTFEVNTIPLCPYCGATARPNILMFGDWGLWTELYFKTQATHYMRWLNQNRNVPIAIIEIGAGIAIPTIRYESERVAKQFTRATLIRINPDDAQIDKKIQTGISISSGGLQSLLNNAQ